MSGSSPSQRSCSPAPPWSQRFDEPGAYRIDCSFHRVHMWQYVRVR